APEAGVRVDEGCKHAAVQAQADMTRGKEFDAAAAADDEANLAVARGRIPREPEGPGQKRPPAPAAKILQSTGLPVIDGDLPVCRGSNERGRNEHVRMLM